VLTVLILAEYGAIAAELLVALNDPVHQTADNGCDAKTTSSA